MRKQEYKSPNAKVVNLAIRRSVCQQVSSDGIKAYGAATFEGGDDFEDLELDGFFN